jgi:glycosyltransferase involved in cell wall biosynthesis
VRIGINALYLIPGGVGGTEVYLRRLVEALEGLETEHEFIVFTNRETGRLGRRCVELPVRASFRPGRLLYEQLVLPRVLRREGIEALLNPGFTAPAWAGAAQATVFHDLQHKRHPEYFRWYDLPFWEFFLWVAVKRSQRLIAVSEATRADLRKYYGVDAVVVEHGVEREFFELAARREDGAYLLCASTTHPHKNHERLLRAFARLRREAPEARLVLTGVRGFVTGEVERAVVSLGLSGAVELKGWVAREELYELFRRARGFVYPTKFEGFGMPVLEAMAADVPLACSAIEPLKGLVGECAVLFDPESEEGVLEGLRKLWRGEAPGGGPRRAARFSWERAARETVGVIEDSLRAGSSRRFWRRGI